MALEAKQHRGRILDVDIKVGQRLIEGRNEVAEPPVVKVKNRVEFALLKVEHRAMPPKVMDHIVAAGKVSFVLFKQVDPFTPTALHLHDMRDGVDTPKVGRVDLQGAPPRPLSGGIVTTFFIGKAAARQDGAIARHVLTPFRKGSFGRSTHRLRPAKPKIVEVGEPKGEYIRRMFGDNVVPDRQGAVEIACNPGIQCIDVSPFPRSRFCCRKASGSSLLGSQWNVGQLVRQHREVTSQAMRETKIGIGGDSTGEVLWGIGTIFQIPENRSIKADSCFDGRCGERQSMLILKHAFLL